MIIHVPLLLSVTYFVMQMYFGPPSGNYYHPILFFVIGIFITHN